MPAALTPQPISSFPEITDLNNFNTESLLTLLNANASTPSTQNANLKFKNLFQLINNEILPINDSQVSTGINPNNINTNQLATITSVTVNQYGRVVQIEGVTSASLQTQAGISTGILTGTINVPLNQSNSAPFYGSPADFTCNYTGKIMLTIYYTSRISYTTGNNTLAYISTPPLIYVTNNTNVVTQIATVTGTTQNTAGGGGSGAVVSTGTAVALLPCSAGTTGWKVGVGYPTSSNTSPGFPFNYTVLFQNTTQ